jgi:hypothetical protein
MVAVANRRHDYCSVRGSPLLFAFAGFGEGVVEVLQKCGLVGEQLLSDFDFDVSLAGAFV